MYTGNKKEPKLNGKLLAIESSCDETAASIIDSGRTILSSCILSSATEHIKFGGVVPEVASRAHTEAISKVVDMALKEANLTLNDLDGIAVTYGAGLLGALLVGVSYAKSLAYTLDLPLIPVSHIRGHLAAAYLADKNLKPPFITILASGGHTAIIHVKDYLDFEILGSTLDDAVGEAFDKVARTLSLPYPGGPSIEKCALGGKPSIDFSKMFKGKDCYDLSYSGLKTSVLNYIHNEEQRGTPVNPMDVAASFQCAAIDPLVNRGLKACKEKNITTLTAGGGVVANSYFRNKLISLGEKYNINVILPEKKYCTDNAAMIGAEGYIQYINGNYAGLNLNAKAQVSLR